MEIIKQWVRDQCRVNFQEIKREAGSDDMRDEKNEAARKRKRKLRNGLNGTISHTAHSLACDMVYVHTSAQLATQIDSPRQWTTQVAVAPSAR